jgi:triacylglycerol lipase
MAQCGLTSKERPRTFSRMRRASLFVALLLAACGSDPDPAAESPGLDAGKVTPTPSATTTATPVVDASVDAEPPRRGPPYPIVLLHGMAGFKKLTVGPIGIEYWSGVLPALAKKGETEVFITEASPYASSDVRAREIQKQLEDILRKTGSAKVNLVAHSQGGIDARLLASPAGLGLGKYIASVTTVATPHRGSRVADLALGFVPGGIVDDALSALLGLVQRTAYDLRTDASLRAQLQQISVSYMDGDFNARIVDDPGVRYESYAGRSNLRTGIGVCDGAVNKNNPLDLDAIQPELAPTALYLENGLPVEVNDGLVTVHSAKWGTFVGCVPADHMDEIGIGPGIGFDHVDFYTKVVARVRKNGF